eukprot:CAMPEP_0177660118 /NCGR_PEP_ID=MMETSP0447-20121125/17836_1 /TAXON_ID=0 /ORGANISM="Stygamoeba regulata, Strain BSH-02190019" /LENGTH=37 /DNA_ID= /DNA_START= /DNA_END= /DNA_ORIENTATION=
MDYLSDDILAQAAAADEERAKGTLKRKRKAPPVAKPV